MAKGRQIKIYLADGAVTGVRHAEIVNWTGQALALPRNRVKELADWQEVHKPGVYFLFGIDEQTGNDAVYIGEAEHVGQRIQQHVAKKDFWHEAVCFSNKDENLTKAHVKYLESRLVDISKNTKRYQLLNGNQPPQAVLPRGDRDAMEEFLANIRLLLGALGYRVLEPLTKHLTHLDSQIEEKDDAITLLNLKAKKYQAQAQLTDEGLVVLAGAEAATNSTASLSNGNAKKRALMLEKGQFKLQEGKYLLQDDMLFTSPSQAASVLLGYPCNGLDYWQDQQGKSLKQLEAG